VRSEGKRNWRIISQAPVNCLDAPSRLPVIIAMGESPRGSSRDGRLVWQDNIRIELYKHFKV